MIRFGALLSTATFALLGAVGACTINPAHERGCYPGDFEWCLCADGTRGLQQCDANGGSYGACVCSEDAGADAAPPPAGDAATTTDSAASCSTSGTANLCLYATCQSDAQCAPYNGKPAQCFAFNAKGPHCTLPCTLDSDCPPPSTGCSNNKVCKEP